MQPVCTATTLGECNRRFLLNASDFLKLSREIPQNMNSVQEEGYYQIYYDRPHPKFNLILNTQLFTDNLTEKIAQVVHKYQKRNTPFTWTTNALTVPDNLGAVLESTHKFHRETLKNFIFDGVESNCASQMIKKTRVVKASAPDQFQQFYALHQAIFDMPADVTQDFQRRENGDFPFWTTSEHYIGYLHNKPISIGLIHYSHGIAGIYWFGILPNFRRQGLGTCFLYQLLKRARKRGFRYVGAQAPPQYSDVFLGVRFRESSESNHYIWGPFMR